MLVGVFHFPTDYGIDSPFGAALEARGFESLFVCEHTHIPISRRTLFPGGGDLPDRYKHTHDPFVALAFAAAATRSCFSAPGSSWCRSATQSSPPSRSPVAINFPVVASSSL